MSKTDYDKLNSTTTFTKEELIYIKNELKRYLNEYNFNILNLMNLGIDPFIINVLIFTSTLLTLNNINKKADDFLYKMKLLSKTYRKELLSQDETFIKLKSDYFELLNNLKIYLKSLEIKDEIVLDIFLTNMIKNGYLSIKDEYVYKDIKEENTLIDIGDLRGSRVMSGRGVCRHIASLISDINNKMGIHSTTIASKRFNCGNKIEKKLKEKTLTNFDYFAFYNHLVTNVKSKKGNFILDPTNNLIYEISKEKSKNLYANLMYIYSLDLDFNNKNELNLFMFIENLMNLLNKNEALILDKIDFIENLRKMKKRKFNVEELLDFNNTANNIFEKNKENLEKFKVDNKELIFSISDKEKIISGY